MLEYRVAETAQFSKISDQQSKRSVPVALPRSSRFGQRSRRAKE